MLEVNKNEDLLELLEQSTIKNNGFQDVLAFFDEAKHMISMAVYYGMAEYTVYSYDGLDYRKSVKDCYECNRSIQFFGEQLDQQIFKNIETIYRKMRCIKQKIK